MLREKIMLHNWELPNGHSTSSTAPTERRTSERRSPWPTVIYTKSERRKHPDRRKSSR